MPPAAPCQLISLPSGPSSHPFTWFQRLPPLSPPPPTQHPPSPTPPRPTVLFPAPQRSANSLHSPSPPPGCCQGHRPFSHLPPVLFPTQHTHAPHRAPPTSLSPNPPPTHPAPHRPNCHKPLPGPPTSAKVSLSVAPIPSHAAAHSRTPPPTFLDHLLHYTLLFAPPLLSQTSPFHLLPSHSTLTSPVASFSLLSPRGRISDQIKVRSHRQAYRCTSNNLTTMHSA